MMLSRVWDDELHTTCVDELSNATATVEDDDTDELVRAFLSGGAQLVGTQFTSLAAGANGANEK